MYVVSRDEISNYGWRDLKEILASIPNMDYFYQWSWLPGGQRGFTGNMSGTLMLIDGREVQNLLANEAFIMNNFPPVELSESKFYKARTLPFMVAMPRKAWLMLLPVLVAR